METPAGRSLGLSGSANNGKALTWMVNTAGFESITVSLAIQRSTTGFNDNQFFYTPDSGASWVSFAPRFSPDTSFASILFDLSGIGPLRNNPDAGFRIMFGGATSTSGNNRIDNLIVAGDPVSAPPIGTPEPSTLVLTAAGLTLLSLQSGRRRRGRCFHLS